MGALPGANYSCTALDLVEWATLGQGWARHQAGLGNEPKWVPSSNGCLARGGT